MVVAGGSSDRPITGISASGNHTYGVNVTGQSKPRITGVVTAKNGAGGLEINRSTDVTVGDYTATDEPIGVYTHVGSARVALDKVTVTGGRRGVVVEKTTTGLQLTASTISGTQLGVSIGAHDVTVQDVTVTDSRTGVAVQRGAGGITATRLTLSGGKDGFVANPKTTGVVLTDLTATGVSNNAVRMLSPDAKITGGRITGSSTGIDVQEAAVISGIAITEVETGIRARSAGQVRAERVDVAAVSVGVDIAPGTTFVLVGSRVNALQSIRGTVVEQGVNDLSLPPLSLLGAIGVPLLVLAIVLELFNRLRLRSVRRRHAQAGAAGPPGRGGVRAMAGERPRHPLMAVCALVVVFASIAGCAGAAPPPSAEAITGEAATTADLEGFLGNGLTFWDHGEFGIDRARLVAMPDAPGGTAMRVSYPAGSASKRAGGVDGGTQLYLRLPEPVDEMNLEYSIRFPAGFDFVKGGKLPGLYGGTVTGGQTIPDGTDGFSTRYMWRRDGDGEVYAYLPTSQEHGTSLGRGCWSFPTGSWTTVSQRVRLNTPGLADGEVTVQQDGHEVLRRTGLTFRTTDELRIEGLFFSTFFGGGDESWASPVDQYAEFAGFRLSTDTAPSAGPGSDCPAATDSGSD